MSQIICHYNIFGDLPNSEDNGRIFGIFLDNVKASNQSMKLDLLYDPDYMRFETKVIIQHDQQHDRCPDFIDDLFVLSLRNRKYANLFTPRRYVTRDMIKPRGTKLYVITNTLEAQHAGWDNEDIYDDRFVLGVFTHRCCAEKFLQEIIQREVYYSKQPWLDDNDYMEIRKYVPIIREYTEGVSDPKFEKERKALKDLEYLLTQVAKDPNHPRRRWKDFSDEDWDSLLKDGIYNCIGLDGKWSEVLEDYLKWMEGEMGLDLRIETVGLKSKDKQLQYAYAEIFRLKSELEKCSLISKKIYSS